MQMLTQRSISPPVQQFFKRPGTPEVLPQAKRQLFVGGGMSDVNGVKDGGKVVNDAAEGDSIVPEGIIQEDPHFEPHHDDLHLYDDPENTGKGQQMLGPHDKDEQLSKGCVK